MDKTWKVTATIKTGFTHEFYATAETLYDAFIGYYKLFGTKHLTGIRITEVKRDE
jgi:hypothetical protein